MKVFKTERIIHFNAKKLKKQKKNKELTRNPEFYVKNIPTQNKILTPKSFLAKKICRFKVEKFDDYFENELKGSYEGRWTLKEHILFLQAIDRYGMNWENIKKVIKTRTSKQIRSHSQKFFKKLKQCKDEDLGIDFTLDSIHNMKDAIKHIRSVNPDFDIVTILLYITEKNNRNMSSKKLNEIENELNINNIFKNDIDVNNICINNSPDDAKEKEKNNKIYDEFVGIEKASFNNFTVNNCFIYNLNFLNVNNLDFLLSNFINNTIIMNIIYNINNNTFINNNPGYIKNDVCNDCSVQNESKDVKVFVNHPLINPDNSDNTNHHTY